MCAVLCHAELWNPVTQEWTTVSSSAVPRTYHSSAVLVPDGRVFVGGGGLCGGCGVNHLDAEMYSPPYLFNADGSAAARPSITLSANNAGRRPCIALSPVVPALLLSARATSCRGPCMHLMPTRLSGRICVWLLVQRNEQAFVCAAPGGSVTANSSEGLSMVSMLRMGGHTHGISTDQRHLELCGPSTTPCGGTSASVTVPGAGVAIPGFWMVFGMNAAGVPSEAQTLQVT